MRLKSFIRLRLRRGTVSDEEMKINDRDSQAAACEGQTTNVCNDEWSVHCVLVQRSFVQKFVQT
jgi:hypothetical protein